VLLWHTVPVNSVQDLKTRETNMGASGANSTPAFYTRVFNATLGTRMKLIAGYPGQSNALLANGARRTRRLSKRVLQRAHFHAADVAGQQTG